MYSAIVPESLLVRLDSFLNPDDELPDLAYLPGPFLANIAAEFFQPLNTESTSSSDTRSPADKKSAEGPCQLPTSKLVGLSVGLPNFALPVRKPHAPDFLIRGFFQVASVLGVGGIRSISPDSGAG